MKFRCQKRQAQERGYILLTLMLVVALLSFGMLAQIQSIGFRIKRDREEEMIHRGVQYSRAVRLFFRHFKRYPASVAELESTNNYRCLRKRYKDPITGKDFKPVYLTEFQASLPVAPAARNAAPEPATPLLQVRHDIPRESDGGVFPEKTNSNSGGSNGSDSPAAASNPDPAAASNPDPAAAGKPDPDDDETHGAPPLHGVPIVGVVSRSEAKSIREFASKDHYNQWLFIFNPGNGTAGLINTPDQPLKIKAQAMGLQNENPQPGGGAPVQK
jgi:type II secretory pathway pseudopilin PulG